MEYQYIPSFTLGEQGSLLDLTPYVPADLQSQYPEWVWGQVKVNNGLWGIPQDTGPMGLLYRNDLFSDAGIEAPATWDDFAAAAETYHTKNPKSWLVNVAQNQPGQLVAYLWQGVRPFTFDGQETVKVDLANDQAQGRGQVLRRPGEQRTGHSDADFNDSWYQGLANGKWATLPIAAWGPVFLQGTAGKTSGSGARTRCRSGKPARTCRATGAAPPMPCSSSARTRSPRPAGPVDQHRQGLDAPPRQRAVPVPAVDVGPLRSRLHRSGVGVLRRQKVNETFAQISETVSTDFGWLPFMDFVYSNFNETLGKAFADKTDAVAGLQAWQDGCVKYAKDQGFTVS